MEKITAKITNKPITLSQKVSLLFLSIFMFTDYILTYIGIHVYNIIEEDNPFMVWLMDLPILQSSIIRIIFITIIMSFVVLVLKTEKVKMVDGEITEILSTDIIKKTLLIVPMLANILVLTMHFIWFYTFHFLMLNTCFTEEYYSFIGVLKYIIS